MEAYHSWPAAAGASPHTSDHRWDLWESLGCGLCFAL